MDIACETVFLKELQKNKAIILTKENTRSARDKKRVAWMAIQQVLVATSGKEYSVQQLCKKWNNLQQRVKEKIRNNGTDKVTKTLHERDLLCLQIIGPENLNLPTGPLDLNLSDLKPDIVFEEQEECPVVVNVTNITNNDQFDNKLIDVMINNHNPSSKQSSESQVLDLMMNNPELKNNLVTSLASLQNTLSTGNTLQSSASGILHGSPGSRNAADITLQDIDNIQTNIFTELANRISQINGTNTHELTAQLASTAEQLTSHHLGNEHVNPSSQMCGDQFTGQFTSSPGHMEIGEYNHNNNGGEEFGQVAQHKVPSSNHNLVSFSSKRKRRSSTLSSQTVELESTASDILALKKEVLQLKKEKLHLKNEKTRLQIEQLRGRSVETRSSETQSVTDLRDFGTQTPEPGLAESYLV